MKYVYYLNLFLTLTTIALYTSIFYGIFAQIIFGLIQTISSIVLLFYWKVLTSKIKIYLYSYYIILVIYGLGYISKIEVNFIYFVMVAPMLIAIYFTFITFKISEL